MPHSDEIRWIPLRNLEPSDRNARTAAAPAEAMRQLEASLEAHGLLKNLVVRAHDDEKTFHVVGGGRRLKALRTLAKKRRSRFRTTTPIPCRVLPDDAIDEEISYTENAVRVNMHPIDEFTAFHTMLERGLSVREIASRFGLTVQAVQRRLRLGAVAPEILAQARDDRLTLDQLQAFASTPDRGRQLDVWNKVRNQTGYTPTAGWIRNELQQGLVSAASARARFVGLKAYKAAGGTVEEDLFAAEDERSVLIRDVELLSDLASKKLQSARRKLGDGWRWIDTVLEAPWDVTRQFGRVKGKPEPPTDAETARLAELAAEIDRLKQAAYGLADDRAGDAERDRLKARIEKLETEASALNEEMHSHESFNPELMACSGCIVTIGGEGDLVVHRGLVRRQDEHLVPAPPTPAPAATPGPTAEAAAPTDGAVGGKPDPDPPPTPPQPVAATASDDVPPPPTPANDNAASPAPPPDPGYRPPQYDQAEPDERAAATQDAGLRLGLAEDLRLIRAGIVKACLECDPELAFDLAAYQMASAVFGGKPDGPLAIEITVTPDVPDGVDPDDREALAQRSPGARMLAAETTCLKLDWLQAPTPRERLLQFRALRPKERRRQFAAAVARALTPQLAFDPDARPETEAVVEALDIPFHELYRPDLEHFWRRMGRREMLQVAAETLGEQWAEAHETDRKETLAKAMAEAFGKNPPPAALKLTGDARRRALRWAPPGFEPARASAADAGPADTAPAAELPAWMND
ncbi:MAG: ParB/RepB/Spo0J family partition protein [Acidobacteria bacterium]|nr:ParB/RepB/Spo0J family partition protein [Acidobacteriota bacterium]